MNTEIVYNVTIKVDKAIATEWLHWLQQEHVPEVMATGCFFSARIVQLLEVDESEGPTYAVQYTAKGLDDYNRYIQCFANDMRQKSFEKWGNRFLAFRSVMKVVGEQ